MKRRARVRIIPFVISSRLSPPSAWLLTVLSWFSLAFLIHLVAFAYVEGLTLADAFWVTWQTFSTVGYEDPPVPGPTTRIVVMFVSTLGILSIGAILTAFIEYRSHKREQTRMGLMDNPGVDGYVIINFPGEHSFGMYHKELRRVEPAAPICIVDARLEHLPPNIEGLPGVHFVRGPILEKGTYDRAAVANCKAVVVFPVEPGNPSSDGTTRMIVDLVHRFVSKNTRILALVENEDNYWFFEDSKVTPILASFEILAVVQECQDPYSAAAVEDLFRNSVGPRPITVWPKLVAGMKWKDFHEACVRVSYAEKVHMIPWGHVRAGKVNLTPDGDMVITEGDAVNIITDDKTTWEKFEPMLVRGGSAEARPSPARQPSRA